MTVEERASRTASRIVTEALNEHGGRQATFDQIEQETTRALVEAYANLRGAVWLLEEPCATS